jgi:hypothetical protein
MESEYNHLRFRYKPNRQTGIKKVLCDSRNRCENPHPIVNRLCAGLNAIHARFVYFQVVQYAERLQIVLLKFSYTKFHFKEGSRQTTKSNTGMKHCLGQSKQDMVR